MLLSLIKYFRGYVEVTLWGYAPERFFNLCSNHDILIWDLSREGRSILLFPLPETENPVCQHFLMHGCPVYAVPVYLEN